MSSSETSKLLFIYALTPLHPGAGRISVPSPVDLPIQRDEFGFPTIWSSSLKGVLRSSFQLKASSVQDDVNRVVEETFVRAVFGPEPASPEVSEYSSSFSLLDARLLIIPARSLKGIWIYLTSPHLLTYYKTYLEIAAIYSPQLKGQLERLDSLIKNVEQKFHNKGLNADRFAFVSDEECILKGEKGSLVILNEEEFYAEVFKDLTDIWGMLPEDIERRSIAIVSDNSAKNLVKKSLIIQPRIRLNYESKTVERGGLWDEEYLPQRTLLVTLAYAKTPKQSINNIAKKVAQKVLGEQYGETKLEEIIKVATEKIGTLTADKTLQKLSEQKFAILGGKETIGKGIVKLIWC
ncbi:MAG: type III-B CRISPR module RAMP protein Cmr4 [archaeon YNP-LCB-003-016]|uniref:type III-B CRISPR module RAMP protein Cmr4 n=1 Tax=Candidatus Culexarchaeum yellowstonense TaxID=2928963 RepID=UPI0026EEBCA4|nr:type III-B CRISPR module RAMP protein Cmr4 [Candidatus Culexarchaeum yellowstonense]MCR6692233.1 type III-B CRISPR module RAMP protein Cmr4 [Candidatus Culexarchaeum yellowstonense]